MDNRLKYLYRQIKEREISHVDAAKQLELLVAHPNHNDFPSPNIGNEQNIAEVYMYEEPYLKDHTVNNKRVIVGATYGSLAINLFLRYFLRKIVFIFSG